MREEKDCRWNNILQGERGQSKYFVKGRVMIVWKEIGKISDEKHLIFSIYILSKSGLKGRWDA